MVFQSVPNCAEAVIQAHVLTNEYNNVLNFTKVGGGYDQNDVDALASAVDFWYSSEVLLLLSTAFTYDGTLVRGLENVNDYEAFDDTNSGIGAVSGLISAANVAAVITHRTGLTGRSARGRTYVGGMAAAELNSAATFGGTFMSDLEAAFNALRGIVATAGWAFVVVSRFTAGAERSPAIFFPVTVSQARNADVDSQRGRLNEGH